MPLSPIKVCQWFWSTLEEFNDEQRTRLLQFSTGSARVPAQGFKALQRNDGKYQKFTLDSAGGVDGWLPQAHTCFNRLDMPQYERKVNGLSPEYVTSKSWKGSLRGPNLYERPCCITHQMLIFAAATPHDRRT